MAHQRVDRIAEIIQRGEEAARRWENDQRYSLDFRREKAREEREAARLNARRQAEAALAELRESAESQRRRLARQRVAADEGLDFARLATLQRQVEARFRAASTPAELAAFVEDATLSGDRHVLRAIRDNLPLLRERQGTSGDWQPSAISQIERAVSAQLAKLEPELTRAEEAYEQARGDLEAFEGSLSSLNWRLTRTTGGPGLLTPAPTTVVERHEDGKIVFRSEGGGWI